MEHVGYGMIVFFAKVLGSLPRKLGEGIGVGLGHLGYKLLRRRRTVTLDNLRKAFPEKSEGRIEAIALAVFRNMGKIFHELCWSTCRTKEELRRHVEVSGLENIRAAHEKGKGVLVLTGHFGNWEMLPVLADLIGHPAGFIYRPLDAAPLDRFLAETRTRFNHFGIPKKRSFRRILAALGKKESIYLLMDQNTSRKQGVFVPFFGMPASTNAGLALLALRTGAPVVPIFLARKEDGFKGIILPEVPLIKTGDKEKDIEMNTLAYNQVIESVVRQYPDQWFWAHRRWKTQPLTADEGR